MPLPSLNFAADNADRLRHDDRRLQPVPTNRLAVMIAVLAWPTAFEYLLLCGAALLAGMVNAVAGGGTLLTFPSLLWVLGPSAAAAVIANGTSTITVCPGSIASAWGYRRELASMKGWILPLLIPSILGSGLGTWLVARRDPEEFQHLIPWLIFLATVLFLLQPWLARWLKPGKPTEADKLEATATPRPAGSGLLGILVFQFLIALYGGYFGAGIGILMLSTLALMGISDIHHMNSLKSLLAGIINGVAVVVFILFDKVDWRLAVPMMVSSILGGFVGAVVARRLSRNLIRYAVITIGVGLSGYYFFRTYFV